MCYKKNNDVFEISVKNTIGSTYCNHRLNLSVDQCYWYCRCFSVTNTLWVFDCYATVLRYFHTTTICRSKSTSITNFH